MSPNPEVQWTVASRCSASAAALGLQLADQFVDVALPRADRAQGHYVRLKDRE